jgi:hypothetical protein
MIADSPPSDDDDDDDDDATTGVMFVVFGVAFVDAFVDANA